LDAGTDRGNCPLARRRYGHCGRQRSRRAFDTSTATISLQLDKLAPVSRIVASPGAGPYDAAGLDVLIGKNSQSTRFLKADIGELVAIAGTSIDAADITMLQSYLDAKYGL
jgi:hypothetical protein